MNNDEGVLKGSTLCLGHAGSHAVRTASAGGTEEQALAAGSILEQLRLVPGPHLYTWPTFLGLFLDVPP